MKQGHDQKRVQKGKNAGIGSFGQPYSHSRTQNLSAILDLENFWEKENKDPFRADL